MGKAPKSESRRAEISTTHTLPSRDLSQAPRINPMAGSQPRWGGIDHVHAI